MSAYYFAPRAYIIPRYVRYMVATVVLRTLSEICDTILHVIVESQGDNIIIE